MPSVDPAVKRVVHVTDEPRTAPGSPGLSRFAAGLRAASPLRRVDRKDAAGDRRQPHQPPSGDTEQDMREMSKSPSDTNIAYGCKFRPATGIATRAATASAALCLRRLADVRVRVQSDRG